MTRTAAGRYLPSRLSMHVVVVTANLMALVAFFILYFNTERIYFWEFLASNKNSSFGSLFTLTTVDARGGDDSSCTFMRKNVMLVRRSTVDFKSCKRAGSLAGKVFCKANN